MHRFCGQHFAHKTEAETCTAPLSWEAGCSRNAAAPEAWGPSSDGHCHFTWYLRRLKAQNAFPGRGSGHPACPLPPPGAPSAPAPRASADSAAVLGWSPPQRQHPEISTEEHNQREAFPLWGQNPCRNDSMGGTRERQVQSKHCDQAVCPPRYRPACTRHPRPGCAQALQAADPIPNKPSGDADAGALGSPG